MKEKYKQISINPVRNFRRVFKSLRELSQPITHAAERLGIISNGINFIIFIVISLSFLYLLSVSWLKWGDLLVDTFRDSLVSLKILDGRVLYKDIFYEYGFFTPYFITFLHKIFGVSIYTLVGCGISITILMCLFIYKISRFFLNEIISSLAVLTFLYICAFQRYIYSGIFNFIIPYSFATEFFVLFVFSALYFFLKFIFSKEEKYLLVWSIFLSLAFLSRFEMTTPVWLGFVFIGAVLIFKNKGEKTWQRIFYLFLPVIISFFGYFIFLYKTQAFMEFKQSTFDHIILAKNNLYGLKTMGLDNIFMNTLLVIKSLLYHFLGVFLLGIGSFGIYSYFANKEKSQLSLILALFLIFFVFSWTKTYNTVYLQYKCVPLLLITGIIVYFIRTVRASDIKDNLAHLTIFIISLAFILRIFLNTGPGGGGCYLLPLSLICYYVFFFKLIKEFLRKYLKESLEFFYSVLLVIFIFSIIPYWSISLAGYEAKKIGIVTDRGGIFCYQNEYSLRFWETVEYLKKNTFEKDTVTVIPEGGGINFFSKRVNPLKYYCLFPTSFELLGEDNIISQFVKANADYVVLTHRPTSEHGAPFFGVHYGKKLSSWIYSNYEIAKQFGPMPFTSNEFGIVILKKSSLRPAVN